MDQATLDQINRCFAALGEQLAADYTATPTVRPVKALSVNEEMVGSSLAFAVNELTHTVSLFGPTAGWFARDVKALAELVFHTAIESVKNGVQFITLRLTAEGELEWADGPYDDED